MCLPLLEKAATEKVPSRIINIGSINGIAPPTLQTFAYSSSKAALHHLSKHLASTLASRHITVNAVAPGPFETKMLAGILDQGRDAIISTTALGRLGCETDMGGVCVFLSSRAGAYITGDVIVVDGGSLIKSLL